MTSLHSTLVQCGREVPDELRESLCVLNGLHSTLVQCGLFKKKKYKERCRKVYIPPWFNADQHYNTSERKRDRLRLHSTLVQCGLW